MRNHGKLDHSPGPVRRRSGTTRRRLALSFGLALLAGFPHPAAAAALDLPSGWTALAPDLADFVLAQSPEREGTATVTVLIPTSEALQASLADVFVDKIPELVEALYGDVMKVQTAAPLAGSAHAPVAAAAMLLVALDDGSEGRIEATAYLVGQQLQIVLVAAPTGIGEADRSLVEARALVDDFRARQLLMGEERRKEIAAELQAPETSADAPRDPERAVLDVIHFLRLPFDSAQPGNASDPKTKTALLLEDGRAFEDVSEAPDSFDPQSRPLGSPGAGRWRYDGEGYLLTFTDGETGTAVAKAAKTLPAAAAQRIAGTYRAQNGAPAAPLAETLVLGEDGSLSLGGNGRATYALAGRTIAITPDGREAATYLFGYQGEDAHHPDILVIGTALYERAE